VEQSSIAHLHPKKKKTNLTRAAALARKGKGKERLTPRPWELKWMF